MKIPPWNVLTCRDTYIFYGSTTSVFLFLATTLFTTFYEPGVDTRLEGVAKSILAFWVLMPPVFFWAEWMLFGKKFTEDERDRVKHYHEVARNMWVALVVLLSAYMKIGWQT